MRLELGIERSLRRALRILIPGLILCSGATHANDGDVPSVNIPRARAGEVASVRVTYETPLVLPTDEVLAAWTEQLYEQDSVWPFAKLADFKRLMTEADLPPDLYQELWQNGFTEIFDETYRLAQTLFEVPEPPAIFVMVADSLWDRLPAHFIKAVYAYHAEHIIGESTYAAVKSNDPRDESTESIASSLKKYAANETSAQILARVVIKHGDDFALPVTGSTWRFFNEEYRGLFAILYVRKAMVWKNVSCRVPVTSSNVASVARAFHLPLDLLARELADEGGADQKIELDLRRLVPPFVAEWVDLFTIPTGANCYRAAMDVLSDPEVEPTYASPRDLREHLRTHFKRVGLHATPRPGDVVVYRSPRKSGGPDILKHASRVVAPGVVFTKFGFTKFSPFIFLKLDDEAPEFFQGRPYRRLIYRPRDIGPYAAACAQQLASGEI